MRVERAKPVAIPFIPYPSILRRMLKRNRYPKGASIDLLYRVYVSNVQEFSYPFSSYNFYTFITWTFVYERRVKFRLRTLHNTQTNLMLQSLSKRAFLGNNTAQLILFRCYSPTRLFDKFCFNIRSSVHERNELSASKFSSWYRVIFNYNAACVKFSAARNEGKER